MEKYLSTNAGFVKITMLVVTYLNVDVECQRSEETFLLRIAKTWSGWYLILQPARDEKLLQYRGQVLSLSSGINAEMRSFLVDDNRLIFMKSIVEWVVPFSWNFSFFLHLFTFAYNFFLFLEVSSIFLWFFSFHEFLKIPFNFRVFWFFESLFFTNIWKLLLLRFKIF